MAKMDISITRGMKIPVNKYAPANAEVHVVLKDVDSEVSGNVYEALSSFVDSALALETNAVIKENKTMLDSPSAYADLLDVHESEIKDNLKNSLKVMDSLL